MELSIIIVNWNSAQYLRSCLDSVYKHVVGLTCEIIVVDNASSDRSAEIIQNEFPEVILIQSEQNLGFSRANNLGYRQSIGQALLFLNPDTELVDDSITRMVTHLNSSPSVGAVGCRLLNTDYSLQTSCVKSFPTIWHELLNAEILQKMFPKARLWGRSCLFRRDGTPQNVDVVCGACLMVKRTTFEEAGLFNEDFFLYAEDVDLCYMIRKAGYAVHFISNATVIHHASKSTTLRNEEQFAAVMQRESRARFFQRRKGQLYCMLYRMSTAVAALFRLVVIALGIAFGGLLFDGERLRRSFTKWWRILLWTVGWESWAASAGTDVCN